MTFTIHATKRYRESFGLDNIYRGWFEPCDEYIDIEVDDDGAHDDIVEMIYDDYILCAMPLKTEFKVDYVAVQKQIKKFLDDLDCWEFVEKINRLKEACQSAIQSFTRMETLYKLKCNN